VDQTESICLALSDLLLAEGDGLFQSATKETRADSIL
jgi:hypothetical protein